MVQIKAKMISDSISGNKKAGYVIDELIKAGLPHNKAVALAAYHGSMSSLRKCKDSKSLLKYKYLKETLDEKDADKVINYLSGKKSIPNKKVASASDSFKVKKIASLTDALNLLKMDKLSSSEYQKAKKLKGFNEKDWKWSPDEDLYIKV